MESAEYRSFRRKLIRWYTDRARDLPWRRTTDPYRIWISEIMLQQTTVAAVIPYFERFLARFPQVADLAAADENDVLRLWEGLGYYSRARNLHRAANVIVESHGGRFPANLKSLLSLPGIGRYTAGAIASFAFDLPAPIVEANTLRLYSRLLGYGEDPRSSKGQEILWTFAAAILPKTAPGRINQALMELGATTCTPRLPDCGACPVKVHCRAFHAGTQGTIPLAKQRTVITDVTEVSIAIRKGSQCLLRRRLPGERWAGLWDFVRFEVEHGRNIDGDLVRETVRERTGLTIELGPQIAEFKHGVTRYRITLKCLTAELVSGTLNSDQEWQWVEPNHFSKFPLSVTGRLFTGRLTDGLF
jgi:A/G-specific adenine glycosylase